MRRNILSENDLIKKQCKIECKWDHKTEKWTVKINHITSNIAYSGVCVTMEGFENFREATDAAVNLFKRNIRGKIKEKQVVKVAYTSSDIWPEIIQ
jgi:hypothetical protein